MININKASLNELISLNGIGPAIAKRIIEHRDKNPFKDIYELSSIKGLGKSRIDKLMISFSISA